MISLRKAFSIIFLTGIFVVLCLFGFFAGEFYAAREDTLKLASIIPIRNEVIYKADDRVYPNVHLSMLFVGDIMMDRGIKRLIATKGSGDYSFPFREIASTTSGADIAFANLEGPISDKGTKQGSIYPFRMNPAATKALYDAGFDIVSVANNHVGDYGREALEDTFLRLNQAGIIYTGGGFNKAEAEKLKILERHGKKIGFLAFSDVGPKWLLAGENTSGIALANLGLLTEAIRQSRSQVDILVVSFHFGDEYQVKSSLRQQTLARSAIDAGANIVVGHHPHVAQEVEEYNGGVIAYSLGNFVFDQAFSEDTEKALGLEIILNGTSIDSINKINVEFNEDFQPIIKN